MIHIQGYAFGAGVILLVILLSFFFAHVAWMLLSSNPKRSRSALWTGVVVGFLAPMTLVAGIISVTSSIAPAKPSSAVYLTESGTTQMVLGNWSTTVSNGGKLTSVVCRPDETTIVPTDGLIRSLSVTEEVVPGGDTLTVSPPSIKRSCVIEVPLGFDSGGWVLQK